MAQIWQSASSCTENPKEPVFLEEDGPQGFIDALGHLVRKKGVTEIPRIAGISRQNLYRTLTSEGNPNFITVNKVVEALGCKLAVV